MINVATFNKTVLALFFVFVVFMDIALALSIHYDFYSHKSSTKRDTLPPDYFNVIDPWGKVNFVNEKNSLDINLSQCNWFTYENSLGIVKNANIQTAITDFENGFSHLDVPGICIDEDQVYFKRALHKCDGKGVADCIGKTGDIFSRGSEETYNFSCTNNIPLCKSTLGSLSFNFYQDENEGLSSINSNTRFMTFEKIFVNNDTFVKIDSNDETNFYTREGQLFSRNSPFFDEPDPPELFYPLIKYEGKERGNFKQNIKLKRFIFKSGYREDENGPYAEIIFRPYNLYLDVEINRVENQIKDLTVVPLFDYDGYSSQYRLENKIRRMYLENGDLIDTTCTCFILAGSPYISIYRRGKDSVTADTVLIENDDESDKPIPFLVTSTINFSIFFILKKDSGRKWLLIPPIDLGGGKVIPTVDRSSKMRILNAPLQQSTVDEAWARFGDMPKNADARDDSYHGRNPLTNGDFWGNLYRPDFDAKGNPFLDVFPGEKFLSRNFFQTDIYTVFNLTLPAGAPGIVFWFSRVERRKTLIDGDKTGYADNRGIEYVGGSTRNGLSFPNNSIENYLVSIGEKGVVDPVTSPFYTIVAYQGADDKTEGTIYRTEYSFSTISFFAETFSVPLTPGNRILDGEVVWQVVDPTSEINVYGPNYFLQSSNHEGSSITNFIKPDNSPPNYLKPTTGSLIQIIFKDWETNLDFDTLSRTINNVAINSRSGGTGAFVNLIFYNGQLKGIIILNRGSGYKKGAQLTASFQIRLDSGENLDIELTGLVADTVSINYTYQAIPQKGNGDTLFNLTFGDRESIVRSGFEIDSKFVKIVDGQITITKKDLKKVIQYGGNGYINEQEVYIDQLDPLGISTIKNERNADKFYKIIVSSVNTEVENIQTSSLIKKGDPANLFNRPNYFDYNFYDTSPNYIMKKDYKPSPQQIGFIDDNDITKWITTGEDEQFKNYIFRKSQGGITSNTGVYTLQFENLNYSNKSDIGNIISPRENLVIGKFIPYSVFPTENKDYLDDMPLIYNYNSVQFIPNAISDVYTRPINNGELPTF